LLIPFDTRKAVRRTAAIIITACMLWGNVLPIAHAESARSRALRDRKLLVSRLAGIADHRRVPEEKVHEQLRVVERELPGVRADGAAFANYRRRVIHRTTSLISERRGLRVLLQRLERSTRTWVEALKAQRESITTWIVTFGIFRACPVKGPHAVANDFGYVVSKRPGVPRHVHQGDDIAAPYGASIVAPFDGTAVASADPLGGWAVKVYGVAGYVYNAHLSAYGDLGEVTAGEVIGFVGATGDASQPHDHFEWHPGAGPAVDPYPYLMAVC
jgi:murein DD-endopeptidase MepM/ murein hydrolase activator NlpD